MRAQIGRYTLEYVNANAAAEAGVASAATGAAAGGSIWTAEVTGAGAAAGYTVIVVEVIIVGYELYLIDYYWDEVRAANATFHNSRVDSLIDQGMTWKAAEEKAIKETEAFEATIPGYWDTFFTVEGWTWWW